eukprot:CAMPEP_0183554026 /NCGR_PEP_ID=MMETSP0371-20130417/76854_1 /TAXON_ID=268820 /ORGANISM="Peridinium aciculiferum, Strain PAER-2" /LENGTH=83 /DNA_ID=CAMNT_0025759735 /DNA_START=23 /DNA_END=271 /DNA_ORIENTATION=-
MQQVFPCDPDADPSLSRATSFDQPVAKPLPAKLELLDEGARGQAIWGLRGLQVLSDPDHDSTLVDAADDLPPRRSDLGRRRRR